MFIMNAKISERIKKLLEDRGLKQKPFAKAAGIDQSQFNRMMRGVRDWTLPHLQATAQALNLQVGELTDVIMIPIVAEISADTESSYPGEIKDCDLGYVPFIPRFFGDKDQPVLENLYSLRIKDDSFAPALLQGSKLIVEKEGNKREGDLVVYCDGGNILHIGLLCLHDDQVLLRSISPGKKDLLLPRRQLASMDPVIGQSFR
jgi:transcriptional regulator with XRE-family HTH domain